MLARIKGFVAGLSTGALVATGVALWIGTADGCRHHKDAALEARPVEALPTPRSLKIEAVTYTCPELGPVVVLRPTPEQAENLDDTYSLPTGTSERYRILGEHDLPRMEWGGTALSYLDDFGKGRVLVKPKPEPLIEVPSVWEFYAEVAQGLGESDGTGVSYRRGAVGARYDALRFSRLHLQPGVEAGYRTDAGAYVEGSIRLAFRGRR